MFARSVLFWRKPDRIKFSNIQIHCYCCFELSIKSSYHKTSYLSKMIIKIIVFYLDMIFWSMIDAFKWVLIGLALWEFDSMCAMLLVFFRWQKNRFCKNRSYEVSWVRCGTWLYRFLIFAVFLSLTPEGRYAAIILKVWVQIKVQIKFQPLVSLNVSSWTFIGSICANAISVLIHVCCKTYFAPLLSRS